MKSCLNCGTQALDDAQTCDTCSREFAYVGVSDSAEKPMAIVHARPDGSGAQSTGIVLAVLGVAAVGISAMTGTTEYSWGGDVDPDKVALKTALSLIGGALLQIGLVVWLAGYIVRAISFLPGRVDR